MTRAATYDRLTTLRQSIDDAISNHIPERPESKVEEAMRYAVLGGGKRLRPMLSLGVAEIASKPASAIIDTACAIELVHAASLIIDDLPCMDDSAIRRGHESTHIVFGEATAILAAFALIARAFELVGNDASRNNSGAGAQRILAQTIGPEGLAGGQHADLDLDSENAVELETLAQISHQKSAALFVAAVAIPAEILGLDTHVRDALRKFATEFGIAFQMADDLMDTRSGHDSEDRATFSTVLGEKEAADRFHRMIETAQHHLAEANPSAGILNDVCNSVRDWAE